MKPELGKTYLVTTENWFVAPDGDQYRAVFGTITGVYTAEETLGVKTNNKSTNWYVQIGRMTIAGCQIHYCIQTDHYSSDGPIRDIEYSGDRFPAKSSRCSIYNAEEE